MSGVPVKRILMPSFLAGLLPGCLAPILFPFVVLLVEGRFPDWKNYPAAALTIALFGAVAGTIGSIALGVPSIFALEKLNLNKPPVVAAVGAVFGLLFFLLLGPEHGHVSLAQSWPIAAFVSLLAAVCGYSASKLSRFNIALQPKSPRPRCRV